MDNQPKASGKSPLEKCLQAMKKWIQTILDLVLSYYAELITQPFRSGLVYFLAGLLPALFVGWILFPMALYSKQPQPFNFSHAIHMDGDRVEGIKGNTEIEKCLYCHEFRKDGTFAGIPKLAKCMECHDDPDMPLGEIPDEAKFTDIYVAKKKEVPWRSYYQQPDCVYFSHIAHVKMGNLDCRTCHGDYAKIDRMPTYKENRLTGYSIDIWGRNIIGFKTHTWDRMKMDDCAECHTKMGKEEDNACFVCHK